MRALPCYIEYHMEACRPPSSFFLTYPILYFLLLTVFQNQITMLIEGNDLPADVDSTDTTLAEGI